MQPLALQKTAPNNDSAETSGPMATSSKSASGPVFNDILADALPKTPAEGATAASGDAKQAPANAGSQIQPNGDGTDADANAEIEALAAATQVASRGVVLKPTSNQTDDALSEKTLLTNNITAPNVDPAGISTEHDDPDAKITDQDTPNKAVASPNDATLLPVQSLIELVAATTMHKKSEESATLKPEQANDQEASEEEITSGDLLGQRADIAPSQATSVENPTDLQWSTQANKTELAEHSKAPQATKVANEVSALRAVAWFQNTDAEKMPVGENSQSEGGLPDELGAQEHAQKEESLPIVDEYVALPTIEQQPQPVHSTDMLQAGASIDSSMLGQLAIIQSNQNYAPPATSKQMTTDLAETQPVRLSLQTKSLPTVATGADQQAAKAMQNTQLTANVEEQSQPGADNASATKIDAASGPISRGVKSLASTEANDTLTSDKSSSSKTGTPQASTGSTSQTFEDQEPTTLAELPAGQDAGINNTSPQTLDAKRNELAKVTAQQNAKELEEAQPVSKLDISIHEIMKLGATDVTLTVEPPTHHQDNSQYSAQAPTNQTQQSPGLTQQQAAPAASANVQANNERRNIADDIRLRALERMVVNAVRNGTQILTIQLYPPGLGQVVLRMAMDGQRLRLSTRTSTTEGADTLRKMEVELRDALAGNGVHLAGFDVSEDGTNDEADHRKQQAPTIKPSNRGTDASFSIDLNA